MNPGDKVKVVKGDYAAWEGEVIAQCVGSSWWAVKVRYRDQQAIITVQPGFLQVIEPAPAPAPDVPGWEYYTPAAEDA